MLIESHPLTMFPLWETGGLIANDLSGNGRNGAFAPGGVTYGQPGVGDGQGCAKLDGGGAAVGYIDAYSASMAAAFNSSVGSMMIYAAPDDAGAWTSGAEKYIYRYRSTVNNRIDILKRANPSDTIAAQYVANGVASSVELFGLSAADFYQIVLTWNKPGDRVRGYLNGLQFGPDVTGLGVWAGALNAGLCGIGAGGATNYEVWPGRLAYAVLWDREITPTEALAFARSPKIYAGIGDSIMSIPFESWIYRVVGSYPGGRRSALKNHAVGGNTIVGNLAAQATATAGDNAEVVIMALGTNDDNAGDMGVLQAAVEAGINTIRANNPRATIYYLNVLPRWTDAGGGTPVDKSNIRAAIAAACLVKGVTCWDTFTDPWINAGDTLDGVHPNTATGMQKVAAEVLARL